MVSVQTLEIACLELFSSVPESFNVYSAERCVEESNCFPLHFTALLTLFPIIRTTADVTYSLNMNGWLV